MNLPNLPSRKKLLIALGGIALGAALLFQQYQLATLRSTLTEAADKTTLNALQSRLSGIDDRLDTVAGKPMVSMDDFRASQQALAMRIDAAQAAAAQAQDMARTSASASELVVLKADLESLTGKMQKMAASRATAVVTTKPQSPPKPKPKAAIAKVPPVPSAPPPFQMVGLEYRGGERFLAIAPSGSTRLSQIYLIRPGEFVSGSTWHLKSVNDRTATFDVDGATRTLNIHP
ncbi:methyl-accepting chemotaxis protein [Pseudomonas guariconensis]|uniref:methyl-accepting chemotaxis protein n=1 Tax=Pseudomonas guariconensis TaxID=1288410 RepID=UPI00209B110B|nr:methyl-accepting chemotaxis protein [Pseudomonas guariconensis]MCO7620152.1 methyl-accepting chemotaxis protein [Pseudomonas guariconensis]